MPIKGTHTHASEKWNIGSSWGIELLLSVRIVYFQMCFSIAFSVFFSYSVVLIYRYVSFAFSSSPSHMKILSFLWYACVKLDAHKYTAHPNGNWYEIGLFAVQLRHLSIAKALTNKPNNICVVKILLFLFRVLFNFSTIVQMNETKRNVWHWCGATRRRWTDKRGWAGAEVGTFRKLMTFEWREERQVIERSSDVKNYLRNGTSTNSVKEREEV